MSREVVLYHSPRLYRLLRDVGGDLVIEVVVGGIAMRAVRVRLAAQEVACYEREGASFSDRLAAAIVAEPGFHGRAYDP